MEGSFELVKRELELILDKEILSTTVPGFPMVRRMTLGMNSPLVFPSLYARATADAVSEKNLRKTAPMVLARWKTAAYKGSSVPRRLAEVVKEMEVLTSLATEEVFRPQKASTKKSLTSGQTWEVDVGKEWISSKHQVIEKQVASDPLEKNATRKTARPWWVAQETMKELEDCLKKLDRGVSRKCRNWATQQQAEINKLELGSQLKRTWQKLLREYFEEAMRTPSSALPLMANPFVRTAGQLMFAWSLVGIELEVLTSHDKLKLGNKSLEVYQMLVQHITRDISGLSLARRKDATCFLRWIMSVMTNSTVQVCHQKAKGVKNYGEESLRGHTERIPQYGNRKGR